MTQTLNQGQQAASDEIFRFLLSNEKEMSISGPAGVGKTFLLQHLIGSLLPMYRDAAKLVGQPATIRDVALTATTNRAADHLSAALGSPAQTIHSFMNLKVYDDYETGKSKIQKTRNFMVHHNTLIIIDEASMIDMVLDKIMQEGTASTCKIIYVGDDRQLAPVGERISVVFSRPMRRVELTQPMRNAGQPALMALCQQFRETVETGVFKPITLVPGVIDNLSDADMQSHVDTHFKNEGYNSRILAYTNKQVGDYNGYIRSIRGYGERLHDGERVINNSAIDLGGTQGMIHAEAEFIVKTLGGDDVTLSAGGCDVEAYQVSLVHPTSGANLFTVYQPVNREHFNRVLKYLAGQKNWHPFYYFKNRFPDLRARDSSTVYKAQGSTFDSVYIDLQNIGTSNILNQVARMLYVAVSRPRNRIFLYGRLPPRYSGG